ncbi:MAG: hypothetical protein IT373_18780 [Polyangiaceae bacterium]|nr:hypothetical protein [Polyangiaceae bacterium]
MVAVIAAALVAGAMLHALVAVGNKPMIANAGFSGPDADTPKYPMVVRVEPKAGAVEVVLSLRNADATDAALVGLSEGMDGFDVDVDGDVLHLMRLDEGIQDERNRHEFSRLADSPIMVFFQYFAAPRVTVIPAGGSFRQLLLLRDGLPVAGRIRRAYLCAARNCTRELAPTLERTVAWLRVTLAIMPLRGGIEVLRFDGDEYAFLGTRGVATVDHRQYVVVSRRLRLPEPLRIRDWQESRE